MGALRNLIGTETKKLFQNPARWREALRPRRWRQFLHVAVFYLRTGNRWQAEPSDGSFERRVYPSYHDYLKRQQAKLEYLDLSHYEAEYQRLRSLGVRFTQEPLEMGAVTTAVFDDTCGNLIQIAKA